MLIDILFVIAGAAMLGGGGELLVRGAAALAKNLGVSAVVIGLTVVAMGTSAPELVVSLAAALRGNSDICAGNVIGSNILNIAFILALTALIYPIHSASIFVKRDIPIMIGVSALFVVLAMNGRLDRAEGALLLLILAAYTSYSVWEARRQSNAERAALVGTAEVEGPKSIVLDVVLVAIGLGVLAGGSEVFLLGAVGLAKAIGVSDVIIGLTLVALGTSLPELATCIVAAWRKQADICLGNIVGSNLFNLAGIAGLCGLVRPLAISGELVEVHLPVMLAVAVLLWPMAATGRHLSRVEGAVLMAGYGVYLGWLIRGAV